MNSKNKPKSQFNHHHHHHHNQNLRLSEAIKNLIQLFLVNKISLIRTIHALKLDKNKSKKHKSLVSQKEISTSSAFKKCVCDSNALTCIFNAQPKPHTYTHKSPHTTNRTFAVKLQSVCKANSF